MIDVRKVGGVRAILVALMALAAGCAPEPDAQENPTETAAAVPQDDARPEDSEVWEPEPSIVTPAGLLGPPSDAIVLFDGTDLSAWSDANGGDAGWSIRGGAMTVVSGSGGVQTRQGFGDVQLHIEWRTPGEVVSEGQGRGNSGIFFMERYELQVLDSYNNRTYSNGQAGSIYKQFPSLEKAFQKYNQTMLARIGDGGYNLGTNFPWKEVSDLKGHKILGAGLNLNWMKEAKIGIIPVTDGLPGRYQKIKTCVADLGAMYTSLTTVQPSVPVALSRGKSGSARGFVPGRYDANDGSSLIALRPLLSSQINRTTAPRRSLSILLVCRLVKNR